jgi:hypothetical protein
MQEPPKDLDFVNLLTNASNKKGNPYIYNCIG